MLAPPPLALSLLGLRPASGGPPQGPRAQIEWVAQMGYPSLVIDAARDGLRPRQLDRSARRDVLALLRRMDLRPAGIDLPIPPAHFREPASVDRAISAAAQALALAADFASQSEDATVTIELPEDPPRETVEALLAAAEASGARLADRRWPPGEFEGVAPNLGVSFDPAAVLLAGEDPAIVAGRVADRLLSARLSDIAAGGRVAPGEGRLDIAAYLATVASVAPQRPVVLDLAGVRDQQAAAAGVLHTVAGLNPGA